LAKCDLREKIAAKLGDLQKYAKMGVPHKHGDNFYFSYNSGLQNQALIYKITAPNVHEVSEQDPTEGT
jgi:prolyl oligopeptidase